MTVKELVDRVDLAGITLCYAVIAYEGGEISRKIMDCYRDTFAPEILSHPDLALIDRCKTPPVNRWGGTYETFDHIEGAKIMRKEMLGLGYKPVIPLAEALKELE